MASNHRFPAVRPEVPGMTEWCRHLERAETNNWFTNFGELSRELEGEILSRWGFPGSAVICTNNGTSAIAAPLIVENVDGPVLLPAFTFPATLSAVKMAGGQPKLLDVSFDDWLVDADELDKRLGETKARAAVLVSPFGIACDFTRHIEVAASHSAILIIDSAAGLGAPRRDINRAAHVYEAYSMHATKPFGVGEGGALFCAGEAVSKVRSALNFGLATRFGTEVSAWGINGKMSEVHAAVGLAVLDTLETRLALRRELASRYMARLKDVDGIDFPRDPHLSTWQVFPVLMPNASAADALVNLAGKFGMEVRRYYRPSLTHWLDDTPCPNADLLAEQMVCFPIYSSAELAEEMAGIVHASVLGALRAERA